MSDNRVLSARPLPAYWLAIACLSLLVLNLGIDSGFEFLIGAVILVLGAGLVAGYRPSGSLKNYCLSFCSILTGLAIAEAYCYFDFVSSPQMTAGFENSGYYQDDFDLGYSPQPSRITHAVKMHAGAPIYDVTYTIDEHGLRETPAGNPDAQCRALFFGGSIMFGEGVENNETMPFHFVSRSEGKYQGFNFGFHGYGPHQMLRAVETGRIPDVEGHPRTIAVYQGIPAHVARSAGKAFWDQFGPRYEVKSSGELIYTGPFRSSRYRAIETAFRASYLFRFFQRRVVSSIAYEPDDLDLYTRILVQTRSLLKDRYGSDFVILFWDKGQGDELSQDIQERLSELNFRVVLVSDIIPEIATDRRSLVISEFDHHPNPLAHALIGKNLAHTVGRQACG